MRRPATACLALALCLAAQPLASGQTRDEMVRNDRAELADDPLWTYNDLEAGLQEARASGRPLMVVLRCIP